MTTPANEKKEQEKRLLRAKIAIAIQDETGKAPTEEQINQVFFLSRVMWKSSPGTALRTEEAERRGTARDFLVSR